MIQCGFSFAYKLDLIFFTFQGGEKCSFYGWGLDTKPYVARVAPGKYRWKYGTYRLRVKHTKVGGGKTCTLDYPGKSGLKTNLLKRRTFCTGSWAKSTFCLVCNLHHYFEIHIFRSLCTT